MLIGTFTLSVVLFGADSEGDRTDAGKDGGKKGPGNQHARWFQGFEQKLQKRLPKEKVTRNTTLKELKPMKLNVIQLKSRGHV